MNTTTQTPGATGHTKVPNRQRLKFLPKHFGPHMMRAESAVYDMAGTLIEGYNGGYWEFYELPNGGCFMAFDEPAKVRLASENGFDEEIDALTAGVIVTLYALSHLAFRVSDDRISEHYHMLREWASEQPQWGVIARATD